MVFRYTSPGVPDNNIGSSASPSADAINHQVSVLKTTTSRLKSALEGEDVNVVKITGGSGDGEDGSGSASGSGSGSGDENDITLSPPTEKPKTDGNEIDEGDNMLGGGVSNTNDGSVLGNKKENSSSRLLTHGPTALIVLAFLISRIW